MAVQTGSPLPRIGGILPSMKRSYWLAIVCLCSSGTTVAETHEDEIQFLIDSVGQDGCRFVRNDRRWSNRSARSHLQSKWELNVRLVASAEDFIEKIASYSVTSGESYRIRCRGESEQPASIWFHSLLSRYRRNGSDSLP